MPMKGADLKELRKKMKLTQNQLAKEVGLHSNSIARMERSEMTISEPVARLVRLLANQAGLRRHKT